MFIIFKNLLTKKKSNWVKRRVSFKSFTAYEKRVSKHTKKGYKHENGLFARCIDLHLDSMGYVYDLIGNGNIEPFHDVFIKLGVKSLHNAEGIRNLINLGLYGSGCTIFRTLVFDAHMVWYLYLNPDLIEEWQKEKFDTYKDRVDDKGRSLMETIIPDPKAISAFEYAELLFDINLLLPKEVKDNMLLSEIIDLLLGGYSLDEIKKELDVKEIGKEKEFSYLVDLLKKVLGPYLKGDSTQPDMKKKTGVPKGALPSKVNIRTRSGI